MTGIDSSCSDIHRTPKEWTSWLGINYNSFNLAWNGKTFKLELHEPNVFRDGGIFFPLFLSAEYVVILANMVIMMMMIINSRVCCENIAKSLKNCAIRAVFRRRPPQALLVFKTKIVSTVRACHGQISGTSWVNSVLSDYTRWKTWHSFWAVFPF